MCWSMFVLSYKNKSCNSFNNVCNLSYSIYLLLSFIICILHQWPTLNQMITRPVSAKKLMLAYHHQSASVHHYGFKKMFLYIFLCVYVRGLRVLQAINMKKRHWSGIISCRPHTFTTSCVRILHWNWDSGSNLVKKTNGCWCLLIFF